MLKGVACDSQRPSELEIESWGLDCRRMPAACLHVTSFLFSFLSSQAKVHINVDFSVFVQYLKVVFARSTDCTP